MIRQVQSLEYDRWLEMRMALWPETPREVLSRECAEILASPSEFVVVVAAIESALVGFAEGAIRDWAEGCATRPVGYLEAWFVEETHRRCGIGRKLVDAVEAWACSRGCSEMGSDADLSNALSHNAHAALGYAESARLVLFSKKIG